MIDRDDSVLRAVGTAAELLLGAVQPADALDQVLPVLGAATEVHRVHIYENRYEGDEVFSTIVNEWTADGISRLKGKPEETDFPMVGGGFQRWVEALEAGKLLVVGPGEGTDEERRLMAAENIISVLCVPIHVEDRWWGWIDFDDCSQDRQWSDSKIEGLRTVARLIGTSLGRQRIAAKHSEAESKYQTLVEQLPAIVYIAAATPDNRTLYISPQVKEVYGWAPADWLKVRGLWEQAIDPLDRGWVLEHAERSSETGTPFKAEYRAKARYGKPLWIHEESSLVRDEDGNPRFWQGVMLDITNQKLAQEALEESQERYRNLVEQLPMVIYTEQVDTVSEGVSYISPRAQDVFGFDVTDWVGSLDVWIDHIHPDDRDRVLAMHEQTNLSQEPFKTEYRFLTADGRVLWIHDEASLVVDSEGEPVCWQGFMIDVTELKEAEGRLQETEQRYRSLVERTPGITYIEEVDGGGSGRLTYISPQVEQILGFGVDEWLREPSAWREHIHPDDCARIVEEFKAVEGAGGSTMITDFRSKTKDGRWLWFRDESVLVYGLDGKPAFWQGVMSDITTQREADERVREAEERYRTLVEQLPGAVYIDALDGIGKSEYMSPQVIQVSGFTPEEWLADEDMWRKVLHPEDRPAAVRRDIEIGETGEPFNMEYRIIRKDGEVVWIHDQASLVLDENGKPDFWQGVMLDVSEAKRTKELESELETERETAQRLREIDEMKNTFLTAVSHDLRTPLAAILGLALTLEREELGMVAGDGRDLVTRIAENARKLDRLVSDLLDLDRLTRGILEPKRHPTDVGAVVRRVVDEADFLGDHPLEMSADPVIVAVDGAKVERIIENLLSNVARHTPTGTQVWITVHAEGDGAVITVEDSGPGVPAEMEGNLFEPFAQGSEGEQARYSPGVGIGLSLVARFSELHGGSATVGHRDGGGTVFTVHLPNGTPTFI